MPHNDNKNDDTGRDTVQQGRILFGRALFVVQQMFRVRAFSFSIFYKFFFSLFLFVFRIFNAGNACGILAARSIELLWFLPSSAAEPWSVTRTAEGLII